MVPTMYDPTMPIASKARVSMGIMTMVATTRGMIRYLNGFTPMTTRASTCWVTCMMPISAVMAEPARAVTMSAASTGPSSLRSPRAVVDPTRDSAPKRLNPW